MTTRRNFLKTGGLSLASLMVGQHSFAHMAEKADDKLAGAASTTQYVCKRPVPSKRQFTSEAVEKAIATTKAKLPGCSKTVFQIHWIRLANTRW